MALLKSLTKSRYNIIDLLTCIASCIAGYEGNYIGWAIIAVVGAVVSVALTQYSQRN